MLSVYELISDTLVLVGALGVSDGDDLNENVGNLALRQLNGMLAGWSTKDLINYSQTTITIPAPTNGNTYVSFGSDGVTVPDSATRFVQVKEVHIKMGVSVFVPTIVTFTEYDRTFTKQTTGIPQICAYDYQFPIAKLYMWPIPLGNTTVDVIGVKEIGYATSFQGTLDLPNWWHDPIVYNLAVRLGLFIGSPPDEQVSMFASHSLSGLKQLNSKMRTPNLSPDFGPTLSVPYQTWAGRVV